MIIIENIFELFNAFFNALLTDFQRMHVAVRVSAPDKLICKCFEFIINSMQGQGME